MRRKPLNEMTFFEGKIVKCALNNNHHDYFCTTHFTFERDFYSNKEIFNISCNPRGIYNSISDNVPYNHNNKSDFDGASSLKFVKRSDNFSYPFISIIIPVYNAEDTLDLCLKSINEIDYPNDNYEIFIVDNGSTDASVEIAQKYRAIILFEQSIKSSYAARNKGIQSARGDLIAFTDADCIVTPGWLRHLVKDWADTSIGCFAGEIEAYQPSTLIEIFSDRQGILRQRGTLNCSYLPYTQTANSAYRKEVFDKIGLFIPEMTSGGDGEISWRMQKKLGLGIKFVPEALVYHKHRTSLIGLYNQYKKYEHGKLLWHKYYPDYPLPSVEQREHELNDAIDRAHINFKTNKEMFVEGRIDLVDLLTPWLLVVMRLATYRARVDALPQELISRLTRIVASEDFTEIIKDLQDKVLLPIHQMSVELKQRTEELNHKNEELRIIYGSLTWRMGSMIINLVRLLFPDGSLRRSFINKLSILMRR